MTIGRRENFNARNGTQASYVLCRLMATAQVAVYETCTVSEKNHWEAFMSYVKLDLLEGSNGNEGGQPIDARLEAHSGKPCRHTDHVLLSNASVYKLRGKPGLKGIEKSVPMVTSEQYEPLI